MKKTKRFQLHAPAVKSLSEANALIQQLWEKLCEYEDRLAASSRNSLRSPSSDSSAAKAERKKLQHLVVDIRHALSQATSVRVKVVVAPDEFMRPVFLALD